MTLAELQQIVARINALYQKKGQLTAMAVLPPQEVTAGLLKYALLKVAMAKPL